MPLPIPTNEQAAIISAATGTTDNLIINALAGAAKTTTLELICAAIRNIPILSLAFNKRIASELAKRLPGHVECRTLNALGHRVWASKVGRLTIDTAKMRDILRSVIDDECTKDERAEAFDEFSTLLRICSAAKRSTYVPRTWLGPRVVENYDDIDLIPYEDDISPLARRLVPHCIQRSIVQGYEGLIDFDDQIYMPVLFGGSWPKFPLVLVDEAQDLNELQHEMLQQLVVKRLIAVGDPFQSIYAFRGALQNSMNVLAARFAMQPYPLSISFRVPIAGVKRAWDRAPHMLWRPDAPEGHVEELGQWTATHIPAEAAIICRNNAPLISMAFKLLRAQRAIKLVGMDIGAGLVKILKKLGPANVPGSALPDLIETWYQAESRRSRKPATLADRMECLLALCEGAATLGEAITRAEHLFKREGPIQLLSGHKAKGLEWDVVYHLDSWRIPSVFAKSPEAIEQELNIRYVIESRFKQELYLVDLENYR